MQVHLCERKVNVLTLSSMLFCFPFNIIITCRNSCFFQNNLEIFSENNCQFPPTKEFSFWTYRDWFTLSLNCSLTSAVASVFFLCFLRKEVFSKGLALENFYFNLLGSNACFLSNLYGVAMVEIPVLCYFIAVVAGFSYSVTWSHPKLQE